MAQRKPIILLVDDDANDEELAKIALEATSIPHQLVIQRDGAEALKWLHEARDKNENGLPHLVLLDLKLPKVTGLEVLENLRSHMATKSLPVVIFTSSIEARDLHDSYEFGANAYIRKPIDFKQYRETVGDMARFWILHNHSPHRLNLELRNP